MMINHTSELFNFDKSATSNAYDTLDLKFDHQKIKDNCLGQILSAIQRTSLNLGIDYTKPWEEISMESYYQIEYIFVGKILSKNETYIPDDFVGINVFEEDRYLSEEFGTKDLLNLTFIINK